MKRPRIQVKLLCDAPLPERFTPGASGFDLASAENRTIPAHGSAVVRTGLALGLPKGLEAQVRPRSGLAANHGIGILNSPGTIDADYRGEIKVVLFNCSCRPYRVRKGDRICQLVFSRVTSVELKPTARLSRTPRGSAGFGHTGRGNSDPQNQGSGVRVQGSGSGPQSPIPNPQLRAAPSRRT